MKSPEIHPSTWPLELWVQLLCGNCGNLVPPQAGVVPGGPYPARGRGVELWRCPGSQGSQNLGALVNSKLPAASKETCCADTLAGQRGLLNNSGTEAAVFSMDVSAKETITSARWHCLLQPDAIPPQETPQEPSRGRVGVSSSGTVGPFKEQERTHVPSLWSLSPLGWWGQRGALAAGQELRALWLGF